MPKPAREPRKIVRRPVRVKPHGYQPKKAELEDPFAIRKTDGTMPTAEELAKGALGPVTIVEASEA